MSDQNEAMGQSWSELIPEVENVDNVGTIGELDPDLMDDFLDKAGQLNEVKEQFLEKGTAVFEDGVRIIKHDNGLVYWKPLPENRFVSFAVEFDFDKYENTDSTDGK